MARHLSLSLSLSLSFIPFPSSPLLVAYLQIVAGLMIPSDEEREHWRRLLAAKVG